MIYISEKSIRDSWIKLIEISDEQRLSLNKFVGILEVFRHLRIAQEEKIKSNCLYKTDSRSLSNELQSKFFFGESVKLTNSKDSFVVFPNDWDSSILEFFLNHNRIHLDYIISVCLQTEGFESELSSKEIRKLFFERYHINEDVPFFLMDEVGISFQDTPIDRKELFKKIKKDLELYDDRNTTLAFDKKLFAANPGEITRGPLTQPLYSGQDALRCLMITNFDTKSYYNIGEPDRYFEPVENGYAKNEMKIALPQNKIIYGAPGTGKSFELRAQSRKYLKLEEANLLSITFYSSFSYHNFIGTYKPISIYKSVDKEAKLFSSDRKTQLIEPYNKEPLIDYAFVPGPLIKLFVEASNNLEKNYLLIIEEINRADAANVFGDFFQLLDRNDSGVSEYSIYPNSDICNYLTSVGVNLPIRFPSNLYIWATMNSADQGVMPLDTAFKRRWSFEYLPLNKFEEVVNNKIIVFQNVEMGWNHFRNKLNSRLKAIGVPEDKLLGPFFLSSQELIESTSIKFKLLLYLRDDIVRHNPSVLFLYNTFTDIIDAYDENRPIFVELNFNE